METKSEQFRDALDEARTIVDTAKAQDRDLTSHEKSKVDRLIAKAERLKGDLKDEALRDRIGELLGGGESVEGWVDGRSRKTLWECLLAVGGAKTLATTPSVAVPTDFLYPPGPNEGPGASPIFDSFPQKRGSGGSASYLMQTGDVPAAAVPPGTDKPVGAWDLDKQTEDYVTVATLSPPVSTSLFKDDPNGELRRFFEAIMGSAIGQEVDALAVSELALAPVQAVPYTTSVLGTIRHGVTLLQASWFRATHLFLSPTDAEGLAMLAGDPYTFGSPATWVPNVVVAPALPTGVGYVADAPRAAFSVVRQDASVDLDPYSGDQFKKNLVTVRVEARILFAVVAPKAIGRLDLTA